MDEPDDAQSVKARRGPRLNALAFFWGFAEATFFFIIPDVLFSGLAINHFRKALQALAWAVVGALTGGLFLYWLSGRIALASLEGYLLHVPFLTRWMLDTVGSGMQADPVATFLTSGFRGIPYKVYVVYAAVVQLPLAAFIGLSILMRVLRFSLTLVLTAGAAAVLRRHVSLRSLYAIWLTVVVLFYSTYFVLVLSV